jgi:hypothetical protein
MPDRFSRNWILCSALLAALAGNGQDPPASHPPVTAVVPPAVRIQPPPEGHRFSEGVTYHYKAEWRLLEAGTATLRVERGQHGEIRITGIADSTGFVGRLYRVHDVFESTFDPKTFCSQQIRKRTEEGSRRRDATIRFDYQRSKGVLDELNQKNGQRKHLENDIPACAADVLTSLFYAASLPLEPGHSYLFPVNDGGQTATLEAYVDGREVLKTDAGTFSTLRVAPRSTPELLKGRGRLWLWYSDDAERIPIQMRGRMGWGTLTFSLTKIDR